ncbi:MAG: tetratricopeptide repeat protein [Gammaproteobacteria bacterium]|nr:tetratricopeptide repeat protein [Gammaproteobacteria bacterium]
MSVLAFCSRYYRLFFQQSEQFQKPYSLLLCGLLLSACSSTPPAPPLAGQDLTHLLAGELALHRGKNQQASEHFIATAQNTQNAEVAKRATYAAQLSNQSSTYKKASQTWAHLQPDAILAQQHLAQSLYHNRETEAAKDALLNLIKAHPDYLPAASLYAEILLEEQAYQAVDTFLQPYTNKGRLDRILTSIHVQTLTQLEQQNKALNLLKRLINQYPDDASLQLSAGVLYMSANLNIEAQAYFLQTLKLQSDSAQAHYYLAKNYLQLDQHQEAIEHFGLVTSGPNLMTSIVEKLAIEQPQDIDSGQYFLQLQNRYPQLSPQLYTLQTDYLKSLGNLELALAAIRQGTNDHPNNTDLLYAEAMLAAHFNDWTRAEKNLLQVIDLDPNHAYALNALGYTYADHNSNLKQAEIYIKRALALQPNDPAIKDSMGWLAYRQGHYRLARQYLQQAYNDLPDAEVAAHLGVVEWALGNTQQAKEIWQSILQDDPDNALIKQAILDAQKEFPNDDLNNN